MEHVTEEQWALAQQKELEHWQTPHPGNVDNSGPAETVAAGYTDVGVAFHYWLRG